MVKTGRFWVFVSGFLAVLAAVGWAEVPGAADQEKTVVEGTIRASIGWAIQKDKQLLFDSVARDADFFIFHPDSRSTIVGFEPFRKLVEEVFMSPKFKATDFQVKDLRICFAKAGGVAWFSALLDDHGEWDGRATGWDNARWTGVLEKREGRWVIVQMHFSLPSDRPAAEKAKEESK
jgi:hypothetical protein